MAQAVNIRPLSTELQDKAISELNEDPKQYKENLRKFREWLREQPHLCARTDDQHLIAFLRGSKWSLEVAKQKIDQFYTIRTSTKHFFEYTDLISNGIEEVLRARSAFVLPRKQNYFGPTVVVMVGNENVFQIPLITWMQYFFMIMDILMQKDDYTVISGFKILIDYKHITPSFLLHFTPTITKDIFNCIHMVYPMRMKGFIGVNAPKAVEMLYNTFAKPFLSNKIKERICLTAGLDWSQSALYDLKTMFPKEYGGCGQSMQEMIDELNNEIMNKKSWLLENSSYFCDESLRPEQPKSYNDLFGNEGSFRQLHID